MNMYLRTAPLFQHHKRAVLNSVKHKPRVASDPALTFCLQMRSLNNQ